MAKIKITYTYDRYGAGPGVGGNALCSNHHVLPYYVMEYIGLLWVAYGKTDDTYITSLKRLFPGGGGAPAPALVDNMSAAMADDPGKAGSYLVPAANPAFTAFTAAFAWIGDNLFTGPSATYRAVDPSQLVEPEKPLSLPGPRWTKLSNVWKEVKVVHLPHAAGTKQSPEVEAGVAKKIIDAAALAFHAGTAPHATKVSDWHAVPEKDNKKHYPVHVSVVAQGKVDEARTEDETFDWCKMAIAAPGGVADKYLKILQVKGGKTACIKKGGQPEEDMGNAAFVTAFHA